VSALFTSRQLLGQVDIYGVTEMSNRFIFTFLGVKKSNVKFHFSNLQKALPWRERCGGCVKKRGDVSKEATRGRDEERKKRKKLSCVKLAICPEQPRQCRPPKQIR